jgi:OmpA-OmpF porin, OOP family
MHRNQLGVLALLAVASWNVSAADDAGFYLGAGIGQAWSKNAAADLDDEDMAYKAFAGYSFNKYIATEVTYYVDGGTFEVRDSASVVRVKDTGFIAALVGKAPLTEWFSLFAKLGYAFYDNDISVTSGNTRTSFKESDENPAYGIGVAFSFAERFGMSLEWEAIDPDEGSYHTVIASAVYRF